MGKRTTFYSCYSKANNLSLEDRLTGNITIEDVIEQNTADYDFLVVSKELEDYKGVLEDITSTQYSFSKISNELNDKLESNTLTQVDVNNYKLTIECVLVKLGYPKEEIVNILSSINTKISNEDTRDIALGALKSVGGGVTVIGKSMFYIVKQFLLLLSKIMDYITGKIVNLMLRLTTSFSVKEKELLSLQKDLAKVKAYNFTPEENIEAAKTLTWSFFHKDVDSDMVFNTFDGTKLLWLLEHLSKFEENRDLWFKLIDYRPTLVIDKDIDKYLGLGAVQTKGTLGKYKNISLAKFCSEDESYLTLDICVNGDFKPLKLNPDIEVNKLINTKDYFRKNPHMLLPITRETVDMYLWYGITAAKQYKDISKRYIKSIISVRKELTRLNNEKYIKELSEILKVELKGNETTIGETVNKLVNTYYNLSLSIFLGGINNYKEFLQGVLKLVSYYLIKTTPKL